PAITETPTAAPTATAAPTEGPTPTTEPTITPYPTSTPVTMDGYKQLYSDYVKTISDVKIPESTLRDLYRANLIQKKMYEKVTADITPIQEQVWARHILVATEDEAKAVLDRLNKGESWNAIAAEVSTDTANKDNGGDLGWFPRGVMETAFEDAAFSMKVGEISQPIKSDSGYHIIQLVDHEQERPLTASMLDQLKQSTWTKWLDGIKANKKIETFDLWKQLVPTEPTVPAS
ncbi:parvulin-like peptidyl-prolyl isomerase, partial [Longilinea arvoryzae]